MLERGVSISVRVYRLLLIAYPGEFRGAYGAEMAQVFRDRCREEQRRSGAVGLARLWAHTLSDLAATAPEQHIEAWSRNFGTKAAMPGGGFALVASLTLGLSLGLHYLIWSYVSALLAGPLLAGSASSFSGTAQSIVAITGGAAVAVAAGVVIAAHNFRAIRTRREEKTRNRKL